MIYFLFLIILLSILNSCISERTKIVYPIKDVRREARISELYKKSVELNETSDFSVKAAEIITINPLLSVQIGLSLYNVVNAVFERISPFHFQFGIRQHSLLISSINWWIDTVITLQHLPVQLEMVPENSFIIQKFCNTIIRKRECQLVIFSILSYISGSLKWSHLPAVLRDISFILRAIILIIVLFTPTEIVKSIPTSLRNELFNVTSSVMDVDSTATTLPKDVNENVTITFQSSVEKDINILELVSDLTALAVEVVVALKFVLVFPYNSNTLKMLWHLLLVQSWVLYVSYRGIGAMQKTLGFLRGPLVGDKNNLILCTIRNVLSESEKELRSILSQILATIKDFLGHVLVVPANDEN